MKLYWHPFSIIPWRVRIALHEKSLPYEDMITDLYTQPAEDAFVQLNPFAQIPVLEDKGLVLAESIAILEYLEEQYPLPALTPSDTRTRATMRKLMCWGTDYWPPAWKKWMAPRLPEGLGDPWTDHSVNQGRQEIAHHLDVIEPYLEQSDWLVGTYSLADISYAPLVLVLDRVDLGKEIEARPAIGRWVERISNRQSVIDTMMPANPLS